MTGVQTCALPISAPDAAAAECERAPGDSATEPASAWSSDAAESAHTRAPGDSATEPAAVSSPAPNAATAECERAPGDSTTEPAAVSSPDAAAAECERAPGDAAACAHGDKKAAAPELFSVLQIQMEDIGISVLKGLGTCVESF